MSKLITLIFFTTSVLCIQRVAALHIPFLKQVVYEVALQKCANRGFRFDGIANLSDDIRMKNRALIPGTTWVTCSTDFVADDRPCIIDEDMNIMKADVNERHWVICNAQTTIKNMLGIKFISNQIILKRSTPNETTKIICPIFATFTTLCSLITLIYCSILVNHRYYHGRYRGGPKQARCMYVFNVTLSIVSLLMGILTCIYILVNTFQFISHKIIGLFYTIFSSLVPICATCYLAIILILAYKKRKVCNAYDRLNLDLVIPMILIMIFIIFVSLMFGFEKRMLMDGGAYFAKEYDFVGIKRSLIIVLFTEKLWVMVSFLSCFIFILLVQWGFEDKYDFRLLSKIDLPIIYWKRHIQLCCGVFAIYNLGRMIHFGLFMFGLEVSSLAIVELCMHNLLPLALVIYERKLANQYYAGNIFAKKQLEKKNRIEEESQHGLDNEQMEHTYDPELAQKYLLQRNIDPGYIINIFYKIKLTLKANYQMNVELKGVE